MQLEQNQYIWPGEVSGYFREVPVAFPAPFYDKKSIVKKPGCDDRLPAGTAEFMRMVTVWLKQQSFLNTT